MAWLFLLCPDWQYNVLKGDIFFFSSLFFSFLRLNTLRFLTRRHTTHLDGLESFVILGMLAHYKTEAVIGHYINFILIEDG